MYGLTSATNILLMESSAGGFGTFLHADWLQDALPAATVFPLADSAWFDSTPDYDILSMTLGFLFEKN